MCRILEAIGPSHASAVREACKKQKSNQCDRHCHTGGCTGVTQTSLAAALCRAQADRKQIGGTRHKNISNLAARLSTGPRPRQPRLPASTSYIRNSVKADMWVENYARLDAPNDLILSTGIPNYGPTSFSVEFPQ